MWDFRVKQTFMYMLGICFAFLLRSLCALLPAFSQTQPPQSPQHPWWAQPEQCWAWETSAAPHRIHPGALLLQLFSLLMQALGSFVAIENINFYGHLSLEIDRIPLILVVSTTISVFLKVIFQCLLWVLHHSEAASVAWVEGRSFCPLKCFLL